MKYYLIVGEASGDLHASELMRSIMEYDTQAEFRFLGGDKMMEVGGKRVQHYRKLAFMGFLPVLLNLHTILKARHTCKEDIKAWKPDVVILVDYSGFNLKIAKDIHSESKIPIFYYISPKIWAWNERRIYTIKKHINEMFCILPFEIDFYKKHNYPVYYVGNPTMAEVEEFKLKYSESKQEFCQRNGLNDKPILAILPGSRKQEIKLNLTPMLDAAVRFEDYQIVVAGAPSIDNAYYDQFLNKRGAKLVFDETYKLLSHATVALVTSGTATLETALFGVPQVVCYKNKFPKLTRIGFNLFMKIKHISLVNLIAGKEVVKELFADRFTIDNIIHELYKILPGKGERQNMLNDYEMLYQRLGRLNAPNTCASIMVELLNTKYLSKQIDLQQHVVEAAEPYTEDFETSQEDTFSDSERYEA